MCWEADDLLCLLSLSGLGAATWVPLASEAEPGGYSHCPVVPVHEDEEHGSQKEQDGQHDDRHLGEQRGSGDLWHPVMGALLKLFG